MKSLVSDHLLLIYTKQKRDSAKIVSSQKKNKNIISIYDSIKSLNTDLIDAFKKKTGQKTCRYF